MQRRLVPAIGGVTKAKLKATVMFVQIVSLAIFAENTTKSDINLKQRTAQLDFIVSSTYVSDRLVHTDTLCHFLYHVNNKNTNHVHSKTLNIKKKRKL
jgi:hypothetical protein